MTKREIVQVTVVLFSLPVPGWYASNLGTQVKGIPQGRSYLTFEPDTRIAQSVTCLACLLASFQCCSERLT